MKLLHKTILIVLLFTLSTTFVYAHRMLIEPIESGLIRVGFDDGAYLENANVTIYNADEEEIFTGTTDAEGYFYYGANSDAVRIVADDGLGHRVSWNIGDPISYSSSGYRWLKIAGVVLLFLIIAFIFFIRNKKKGAKQIPA